MELAAGTDLLLAEATYVDSVPSGNAGVLNSALEVGRQAHRAKAARLMLTHLMPGTDPEASRVAASRTFDDWIAVADARDDRRALAAHPIAERIDDDIGRDHGGDATIEDVDLETAAFGQGRRQVGVADRALDGRAVGDAPEAGDDLAVEADGLAAVDGFVVGAADEEGPKAPIRSGSVRRDERLAPDERTLSEPDERLRGRPRTGCRASSGRCRSSGSPSPSGGRRGLDSRWCRGRTRRRRCGAGPRR